MEKITYAGRQGEEIENELFDEVHPGVFVKARQMRITSNATIPVWAY